MGGSGARSECFDAHRDPTWTRFRGASRGCSSLPQNRHCTRSTKEPLNKRGARCFSPCSKSSSCHTDFETIPDSPLVGDWRVSSEKDYRMFPCQFICLPLVLPTCPQVLSKTGPRYPRNPVACWSHACPVTATSISAWASVRASPMDTSFIY